MVQALLNALHTPDGEVAISTGGVGARWILQVRLMHAGAAGRQGAAGREGAAGTGLNSELSKPVPELQCWRGLQALSMVNRTDVALALASRTEAPASTRAHAQSLGFPLGSSVSP